MEDHSAPVLTFMITYLVGSVNEVTGVTGATHLLEHMMFKGTPRFNKENGNHIDALLGNLGARLNATTWLDRTNYYEIMPSEYLPIAVEFEADRMRNLRLRPEDLASELTVVLNEYERGENNPFTVLNKMIWATAFQVHPYHHKTIGWRSDIEHTSVEKLRRFYDTFYRPDNATVTVIGDFDSSHALDLIHSYFGKIPAGSQPLPEVATREEEQQGARRFVVKRPGSSPIMAIAWKIPHGRHQDFYALTLLDYILSFGKNSRFYRTLIDNKLADRVFIHAHRLRFPGLFSVYAYPSPEIDCRKVEESILHCVEQVKREGVSEEERRRALIQIEAQTAYNRDGSYAVATELNEAIACGDWTLYTDFINHLKNVTEADIQRVCRLYLIEDHSTTGYFIPVQQGTSDNPEEPCNSVTDPCFFRTNPENDFSASKLSTPTTASKAAFSERVSDIKTDGMRFLIAPGGVDNVITLRLCFPAGEFFTRSNPIVAELTAGMLDKGSRTHDKFALAAVLDNLGAQLRCYSGTFYTHVSARCLARDFTTLMEIIAEILQAPAFDEQELHKLKRQLHGELNRLSDNTDVLARAALTRLIFPETHPNFQPEIAVLQQQLNAVTLEDIKHFYGTLYGNQNMIIAAAGDIEPAITVKTWEKLFADWRGGRKIPPITLKKQVVTHRTHVPVAGKKSVSVFMGRATGLRRTDDSFLPFHIGNTVFGTGFTGRLMSTIRDTEGLTYSIYSGHTGDLHSDGYWYTYAGFDPRHLEQGLPAIRREWEKWYTQGITDAELNAAKARISGGFKVGMSTTNGRVNQLISIAQRGLDVGYLDRFPREVEGVTREAVNKAIQRYCPEDGMVTVTCGAGENG